MRVTSLHFLAFLLTAPAQAQSLPPLAEDGPCSLAQAAPASVALVDDDFDLLLDDGRRLTLAGLEFPQGEGETATLRRAALARLADWLTGANVFVASLAPVPDRWGHIPAQGAAAAEAAPEAPLVSIGAALIAEGLARFRPDPAAAPCAKSYLEAEGRARAGRLGVWATEPEIDLTNASSETLAALARKKGMVVLSGTVLSVGETKSAVYLNFGPRRGVDFAIVILKRNLAIVTGNRFVPQALSGRRVRVRGLIETNSGPQMEISTPSEIQLVDAATN